MGSCIFFFLYLCDIDDTVLFACFAILMMELLTTDTLSEVKSPISGPGSGLWCGNRFHLCCLLQLVLGGGEHREGAPEAFSRNAVSWQTFFSWISGN